MRPLPQPQTRSFADMLGTVTVGGGGATPAVPNGRGSGLRKDPTAWHSAHAGTVKTVTNIRKRMRYIGVPPKQPNRWRNQIAMREKVPWLDQILFPSEWPIGTCTHAMTIE